MTTHSQRALILYRRLHFINHLLTYLLTYSSIYTYNISQQSVLEMLQLWFSCSPTAFISVLFSFAHLLKLLDFLIHDTRWVFSAFSAYSLHSLTSWMKSCHFYRIAQCSCKHSMILSSFSMTFAIFHAFPGLENVFLNSMTRGHPVWGWR